MIELRRGAKLRRARAHSEPCASREAHAAGLNFFQSCSKIAPRLTGVLQDLATKGLDGVIDSAKMAGQVIDGETRKKFADFADQIGALKGRLETFGATLLGGFFKLGEGIGAVAAKVVNTLQGIPTDYSALNETANKVAVAIEKGNVALKGEAAERNQAA